MLLEDELLGAALLPPELLPAAGWSVELEDELEPLLGAGVAGAALELEELDESFLFRSTEPDMEPEDDAGGVLVPEDEDADPDGAEGAGAVLLEDEVPADGDGRSARARGPSALLSQP